MHHHRIAVLVAAGILGVSACGSGSSSTSAPPATETTQDATTPRGSVASVDTIVEAPPPTEAAREEVAVGDMPSAIPDDPCALLTAEEVATVLDGADAGTGTATPAGGSCEWTDASGMTSLEFLIFDIMGEDISGITTDALAEMRATDSSVPLDPIDLGVVAIGGPEDDDVVVVWLEPSGLYQLRLWAVGTAPRPGTQWDTLEQPMTELASSIVERTSG